MSMTDGGDGMRTPVRVLRIKEEKDEASARQNGYTRRPAVQIIDVHDIVAQLTKAQRERIISGYDIKNFARIFEDEDAMSTVDSFLANGMNISETSRNLYMHRNTLMYRLNKIRSVTGLDLRKFDMAVTFEILRSLYMLK